MRTTVEVLWLIALVAAWHVLVFTLLTSFDNRRFSTRRLLLVMTAAAVSMGLLVIRWRL